MATVETVVSIDVAQSALAAADQYLLALWHWTGLTHPDGDTHPKADEVTRLVELRHAGTPGLSTVLDGYRVVRHTALLPMTTDAEIDIAISYLFLLEGWVRAVCS
ncbi:MAG: hypothetical protein ACR2PL_26235 [Dehalococcoidia bacterium]